MFSFLRYIYIVTTLLLSIVQINAQCSWKNMGFDNLQNINYLYDEPFTGKLYCHGRGKIGESYAKYEKKGDAWVPLTNSVPLFSGYNTYVGNYAMRSYTINDSIFFSIAVYRNNDWKVISSVKINYSPTPKTLDMYIIETANPNLVYIFVFCGNATEQTLIGKVENDIYSTIKVEYGLKIFDLAISPISGALCIATDGSDLYS